MKKALVLLLILAVAGGAFAKGNSQAAAAADDAMVVGVGGEVRIGTDVDFIGGPFKEATMSPNADHSYGFAKVTFDKGAGHVDLNFKATYEEVPGYMDPGVDGVLGDPLDPLDPFGFDDFWVDAVPLMGGQFVVTGEFGDGVNGAELPYKLKAGVKMGEAFLFDVDSLYGYFLFLDRQLKLDVAYKGYETIYWRASDIVAEAWDNLDGNSGVEISFMPKALAGLNAGIFFPGENGYDGGFPSAASKLFTKDFLQRIVVGAKYSADAFAASAMFKGDAYAAQGVNFGFKFTGIDKLSLGLDAQLDNLGKFGDVGIFSIGANGEYASAPITAGLTVSFVTEKAANVADPTKTDSLGELTIKPYFYYDIVADTLQARIIPAFKIGVGDQDHVALCNEFDLFWNMNRDGTGDDPAMGMLFKYFLDVQFKDATKSGVAKGLETSKLGCYFRWAF